MKETIENFIKIQREYEQYEDILNKCGKDIFNYIKEYYPKVFTDIWDYESNRRFIGVKVIKDLFRIFYSDGWDNEDYWSFNIPISEMDNYKNYIKKIASEKNS